MAITAETLDDQAWRVAGRLAGADVESLTPIDRGRNNRVYRAETRAGVFALKAYPRQAEDPRDRLGAEFDGLGFLARHGIDCVPRPIAADRDEGFALYQWIEGEPVAMPTDADIDAAIDLVSRLRSLAAVSEADRLPPASEACLSGAEIVAQIVRRLARLRLVAVENRDLSELLETVLSPLHEALSARCREIYAAAGWDFEAEIAPAARTLSPSDFGFHNALRRDGGEIVFLDFEYFGWDDPVRLVADFLVHPAMALTDGHRRRYLAGAMAVFGGDDGFARRLDAWYPLVQLRWCLILLNEFLPERWARRALAGAAVDRETAEARQLDKARTLASIIRSGDQGIDLGW